MADFESLLEQMRNPGDGGVPDTIYDDLSAAYQEAVNTREAKISQLTASNEELSTNLTASQAANWELYQQVPKAADEEPEQGPEEDVVDDAAGIDALFEKVED
jgi:hypothetical protein